MPVIHRDVSPGNVRIGCDGEVKLSNFGFAKLVGAASATTTNLESPKGTLGYMAPEQLLGGSISPRADVYVGALVVRELLTGEPAFVRGEEPYVDFLQAMARPSLAPIASACPDPAVALQKALEADGEKRDTTALEVQRVLNAHLAGGRAKLIQILGPLGVVRAEDETYPDTELRDEERIDDEGDRTSNATMPSMLRLETRARRARLTAATFAAFAVLFAILAARPGMRAALGSTAHGSTPSPVVAPTPPAPALVPRSPEPAPSADPEAPPIVTPVPATTTGELQRQRSPWRIGSSWTLASPANPVLR